MGICSASINVGYVYTFFRRYSLGSIIGDSGADSILINFLTPLSEYGNLGIAIAFCLLGVILSNVMTITGSLSVVIPLMITTLQNLNIPPMPFVYMVAATANIAIMLPSSSGGPAIVASLGINLGKMAKRGALTVLITLPVAILIGCLLFLFWPGFSLAN